MTKQLKIGLTGSIGMGKSTTLKMFKERKILTWCADEAVTRLYSYNGAAVEHIQKISPQSVINNCVSKENLIRPASLNLFVKDNLSQNLL